jgi:ectoine hydroxylase-related dioxygenase (phytanoyl-CoA dioxygenase family)
MSKKLSDKFFYDGYVVVKNILTKNDINLVKNFSSEILNDFSKYTKIKYLDYKCWDDPKFTIKIMKFRKNYRELFSFFYDTIQSNIVLKQICSKNNIVKKIKQILGISSNKISHSNVILRIDGPDDPRNIYDWHQERSYYPMNEDGNGMVVWIPLVNIEEKIGPLHAAIGSHKEGFLRPNIIKKKGFSTQKKVPKQYLKKYQNKLTAIKLNAGDAIFMHMNTFHRSGMNASNLFRLSIVSRYHDASKKDFRPFADLGNYKYHNFTFSKILP